MKKISLLLVLLLTTLSGFCQVANKDSYLSSIIEEFNKRWPDNRTVNIVFHGHSVPTGYFTGGTVSLQSYPHITLHHLKTIYNNAVINVITTSIGGEQAEQGAARFKDEVLNHHPDVLFIDYALNDRGLGVERSEKAWREMIEQTLKTDTKLILLTPTPDLTEDIIDDNTPLELHSAMIRRLAKEYKVGLIDSYKIFKDKAISGEKISRYMSQNNHPNSVGNSLVAAEIATWFIK